MKSNFTRTFWAASLLGCAALAPNVSAQEMPREYADVLKALDRKGDFKDNVLKVNIPRSDLKITVDGVATPTPFGFGGWVAMTKGEGAMQVLMGDLVLLETEVNPVMSALLDNGLEVTALHNHFFFDTPRMFYMHVHGHGDASELAKNLKPALALIGSTPTAPEANPTALQLDAAALTKIIGSEGETNGSVYKITIGRPDLSITEMGARINARMGLNTWAAFTGTDARTAIAGDIAMVDTEIQPVLKALRKNGLSVVAIHNHMTGSNPPVYFLHYWGKGPAAMLARGFRAALDETGPRVRAQNASLRPIVFVCEHGAARSVVAAAEFNRMAAEQNLPWRAVARGVHPEGSISDNIQSLLAKDGISVAGWKPQAVADADVRGAERVVTLGCELPASASVPGVTPESWNIQQIGDGTAITQRVQELLKTLAASQKN